MYHSEPTTQPAIEEGYQGLIPPPITTPISSASQSEDEDFVKKMLLLHNPLLLQKNKQ